MVRIVVLIGIFFLLAGGLFAQEAVADTPVASETEQGNAVWNTLFPDGLLDADGKKVETDVLKDKIVGLYFSAHWCPPCRSFSPELVKFRDNNENEFEIVFISSDKSEEAQFSYMKELEMKWYTVKFGTDTVTKIKEKYGIKSIPTLIILSKSGETISTEGRDEVSANSEKCLADWKGKADISPKKIF